MQKITVDAENHSSFCTVMSLHIHFQKYTYMNHMKQQTDLCSQDSNRDQSHPDILLLHRKISREVKVFPPFHETHQMDLCST